MMQATTVVVDFQTGPSDSNNSQDFNGDEEGMFNDRGYDTKPKCLIRIKDVYSAGNELKQRIKDKFKVLNKIARVGSEYLNLQE